MAQGQPTKVKKKKKSVLKRAANRYKSRLTLAYNGVKAKAAK